MLTFALRDEKLFLGSLWSEESKEAWAENCMVRGTLCGGGGSGYSDWNRELQLALFGGQEGIEVGWGRCRSQFLLLQLKVECLAKFKADCQNPHHLWETELGGEDHIVFFLYFMKLNNKLHDS